MPNPFVKRLVWSTNGNGLQQVGNNQGALAAAAMSASGASQVIDVNGYRELFLEILLAGFTGGTTPSIQFEWDHVDDDSPANLIPLWKPAAASAAINYLTVLSADGLGTAPTVTGWTLTHVPTSFGIAGRLAWTVAGAPTAVNWKAFLYGKGIA